MLVLGRVIFKHIQRSQTSRRDANQQLQFLFKSIFQSYAESIGRKKTNQAHALNFSPKAKLYIYFHVGSLGKNPTKIFGSSVSSMRLQNLFFPAATQKSKPRFFCWPLWVSSQRKKSSSVVCRALGTAPGADGGICTLLRIRNPHKQGVIFEDPGFFGQRLTNQPHPCRGFSSALIVFGGEAGWSNPWISITMRCSLFVSICHLVLLLVG